MPIKKRTIAGGLLLAGAVLGAFMSGLLPGFGSGNGIRVQGAGDDSTRASQSATDETPREPAQAEVPAVVVDSDCSFSIELVAVLIVLFSAAHTVPFVACFFHS